MTIPKPDKVIVFDGACVLCSAWVSFVIRHDPNREFQFAAMQTETGKALMRIHGVDPDDPVTFLVIEGDAAYKDTDAALRVVRRFGTGWRALSTLTTWIPKFFRDPCYRWIARNRYKFFGRRESCYLPPAVEAVRFLR